MKRLFLALLLVLSFGHAIGREGTLDEYGQLFIYDNTNTYTIRFTLHQGNVKFPNIKEVSIIDSDHDEKGNMVIVLYRSTSKEVYFRSESDYTRFVADEPSADVCKNKVPSVIQYRKNSRAWFCLQINSMLKYLLWEKTDRGITDAKRGDIRALEDGIIQNIIQFAK